MDHIIWAEANKFSMLEPEPEMWVPTPQPRLKLNIGRTIINNPYSFNHALRCWPDILFVANLNFFLPLHITAVH